MELSRLRKLAGMQQLDEGKLGVPDQKNLTTLGGKAKDPATAKPQAPAKVGGSELKGHLAPMGAQGKDPMHTGKAPAAKIDGSNVKGNKEVSKGGNKSMSEGMDMDDAADAIKDTHKRMKALHGHAKRHHKKGDHKARDKSLKGIEKLSAMAKDQAPDAMVSEEVIWDSSILEEADMPETVKKAMSKVRELHAHAKAMHKAGDMKAHEKAMKGLDKVCDHCDACMK